MSVCFYPSILLTDCLSVRDRDEKVGLANLYILSSYLALLLSALRTPLPFAHLPSSHLTYCLLPRLLLFAPLPIAHLPICPLTVCPLAHLPSYLLPACPNSEEELGVADEDKDHGRGDGHQNEEHRVGIVGHAVVTTRHSLKYTMGNELEVCVEQGEREKEREREAGRER
jgi:hypothetical protein